MRNLLSLTLAAVVVLVSSVRPVMASDDLCPKKHNFDAFRREPIIFGAVCAALGAGLAGLFNQESAAYDVLRGMEIRHRGLRKAIKETHRAVRKDMMNTHKAIYNVYRSNACHVKLLTNHPVTGLRAAERKKADVEAIECDGTPSTNCTANEKAFWISRAQSTIDRINANIEKYQTAARKRAEKLEANRARRQARMEARLRRMALRAGPEGVIVMAVYTSWLGQLLATVLPLIGLLACQIGSFALFF